MTKILVTGAAGFIGYHTINQLLDQKYEVIGLDNINDYYDVNLKYARLAEAGIYSPSESHFTGGVYRTYPRIEFGQLLRSKKHMGYQFIRLNLEDKSQLLQLFEQEKFDYVINLAAQAGVRYSIENPDVYIQSNIVGFLNILEACRNYPVKHLVYASSSSVYGNSTNVPFNTSQEINNPVSLYAATKGSNELMAKTYNHLYAIPATGLRYFTVYGPWGRPDMAIMLFTRAILKGTEIQIFNEGKLERDFTHVSDVVQGTIKTLFSETVKSIGNGIYNIGKGSPANLMDFITQLEKALGQEALKKYLPMQPGDVHRTWADTGSLSRDTGYAPQTDLSTGVTSFVNWYRSFYRLN
tara:strand:- start:6797 stop:7855 length:1059 start_codon:yes stop_codon:yes gene_type:complete